MHPDDEPQTTLSKWPFILGDVLLVGTALAIAILGDWQLTNWQVGACVASVALGAALFILPYVVEFQVRVREEREDRGADLRVLEKHILSAEQDLTAFDARLRAVESVVSDAEKPNAALAEIIDQKFAQMESARTSQEEAIQALKKELKELPREAPVGFDPEVLKSIEKRLKILEAKPEPEPEPELKPDPAPEVKPPDSTQQEKPPEVPAASTEIKALAEMPKKAAAQIEHSKRSTRERRGPEESRLLQRAITQKGDNSSSAVSRIIESKAKQPTIQTPPEAQVSETYDKAQLVEEKEPVELPDPNPGMLFDEEKITSPVIRTKAKKNDAVLTASVFIGIGNKPFLRGSGGSLSWEKGVAMEFQEIGKWRWVAPPEMDATVEVQIYCNDEEPDQSGKYTLAPGQKLEVSPVF